MIVLGLSKLALKAIVLKVIDLTVALVVLTIIVRAVTAIPPMISAMLGQGA